MDARHDQYSEIADKYDQSFKQMPFRQYLEAFTAFRLLGDITGLAILELACGIGLYTRALRQRGAARCNAQQFPLGEASLPQSPPGGDFDVALIFY